MLNKVPNCSPVALELSRRAVAGIELQRAFCSSRIQGLDSIRALAVLMVLLGHAAEDRPEIPVPVAPLSGLGVKIFFVLSGFLITRLLQDELDIRGRVDFAQFYRRRIARLMPVFYLYLVISISVLLIRGRPIPWDAVGSAIFYFTNYYQAFTGAKTNIVAHCWSLAVEEQFYMLWPLLISALWVRRKNIAFTLVVVILCVWCWRLYLVLYSATSIDYLYRALDTRADELAVGCLIAVLMRSDVWCSRFACVANIKLSAPILIIFLYTSTLIGSKSEVYRYCFGFMIEPIVIGLFLLLTLIACVRDSLSANLIKNRLIVYIGKISYCMYLFHGLIMYSTQRLVESRTESFWIGLLVSFIAVILFSAASFRWFETPMRTWIGGK